MLSFIPQAHYLDRVVKGMVFLYFSVVFVCVFVYGHNRRNVHLEIHMYPLSMVSQGCHVPDFVTASTALGAGF